MPRYRIVNGLVEQDGERHTAGDELRLAEHSVRHLREHTAVTIERVEDVTDVDTDEDPFLPLADIGEQRATLIHDAGYDSLAELANADASTLAESDGISESLAVQAIAEAAELLDANDSDGTDSETEG